jgi:hypothetical protein
MQASAQAVSNRRSFSSIKGSAVDVTNLVKASAEILTITSLSEGDVYKRIEGDEVRFGVVQSVMNNGTEAAVTALELFKQYGSPGIKEYVIQTDKHVAIFPATPLEFEVYLASLKDEVLRNVRDARAALKAREEHAARLAKLERQCKARGFLKEPATADGIALDA